MSRYTATVTWERGDAAFTDNRYSRRHLWRFDGGIDVVASASPHVVPVPLAHQAAVDPEEAFVASLASCHMLWFLSIAARQGFVVERYVDEAEGVLEKNQVGRLAMTTVTLRPRLLFAPGHRPLPAEHDAMHREAHELCFIANSVTSTVRCEAVDATGE
jgi:organic hydroperoxide reductase OsmC/OhrA